MKLRMPRCLKQLSKPLNSPDLEANKRVSTLQKTRNPSLECNIKEKTSSREPIKILLLGTAESGKTTIIKQMRILHINGYSDNERRELIPEIYQNIHESIYLLVQHMSVLGLNYQSCASEQSSIYILKTIGKIPPEYLTEEYSDHVATLWSDLGIRSCYDHSNEFALLDSSKYFLDNLERIIQPNYIPSTEDILRSRRITTGIHKISFRVKVPINLNGGEQEFHMYDVGGQRDQRNKWIQAFEGIQVVLFLISCGDFDQTLREDPRQNRLQEALNLFRGVWQNRFLASAGLIVFLNKQDIMERKIRNGKRIADYFPEFVEFRQGPHTESYFDECDWTKKFIQQKLIDITQEPIKCSTRKRLDGTTRDCYYHFTVATDTNCIQKVFNDIHRLILDENINNVASSLL